MVRAIRSEFAQQRLEIHLRSALPDKPLSTSVDEIDYDGGGVVLRRAPSTAAARPRAVDVVHTRHIGPAGDVGVIVNPQVGRARLGGSPPGLDQPRGHAARACGP